MNKLATLLLASTALVPLVLQPALANPLDGSVAAGSADISGEGSANVTVNQSTDKAIIDWRSFNIGTGETTQFVQPGSQSVTLNRVTGGEGASSILGNLKANGQIFLVNPDGILFGADAKVDVGSLVATTHDIRNDDFMAGTYRFDIPGRSDASVVNLGTITVEDGGFAALVAPGVRNAGSIYANLGKIGLGSANGFTLDFYGDGLLQLAVDDVTAGEVVDLATGETLADLVSNSGLLSANGGTVQLTASAARAVVNSVINNTGNIEADTVGTRNGKIILGAATTSSRPADAPIQKVKVSGNLSAAGTGGGETGGSVQLTGELIELTVATIDAFGWNGGGKVLIGGDYMGGEADPTMVEEFDIPLEAHVIPTSAYVFADEWTSISASAIQDGSGGKVILWSDIATILSAAITARGGAASGDGGFIETSSKGVLNVTNPVDASALNGAAGTWLLDPYSIRIANHADADFNVVVEEIYPGIVGPSVYPNSTASYIDVDTLEAALNVGNNVRIITRGTAGSGSGHIYVEDDIRKTAGGDVFLNLNAAGDVRFSSGVDVTSTSGKLAFHVYATDGKVLGSNVGTIDVNGGQFLMAAGDGIDFHSSGPMPHLLTLDLNPVAPPTIPTVTVELEFDGDKIYFTYTNGVAYVPPGGVILLDDSGASLEIYTHQLDGIFSNLALNIGAGRGLGVFPDAGFNYGAATSNDLDGIPEVVTRTPFAFRMGDDPNSQLVIPLLEVSDDGGLGVDRIVPTSPLGRRILGQSLAVAPPPPAAEPKPDVLPASGTGEVVQIPVYYGPSQPVTTIAPPVTEEIQHLIDLMNEDQKYFADLYGAYAIFSANAYKDRDAFHLPPFWSRASEYEIGDFYAVVYERRNSRREIVEINMAFRGTNEFIADGQSSNFAINDQQGALAEQLARGLVNVYKIKNDMGSEVVAPNAIFTATGHSLGGALAKKAVAAIGGSAITFDSSPRGDESVQLAAAAESWEILTPFRRIDENPVLFGQLVRNPLLLVNVFSGSKEGETKLNLVSGINPIRNHTESIDLAASVLGHFAF